MGRNTKPLLRAIAPIVAARLIGYAIAGVIIRTVSRAYQAR